MSYLTFPLLIEQDTHGMGHLLTAFAMTVLAACKEELLSEVQWAAQREKILHQAPW